MQTVVVCLLVFHCFYFPHVQLVVVVVDPQPAHGSIFNLKSTTKRETHKKARDARENCGQGTETEGIERNCLWAAEWGVNLNVIR